MAVPFLDDKVVNWNQRKIVLIHRVHFQWVKVIKIRQIEVKNYHHLISLSVMYAHLFFSNGL
jgi:hypothetical protein